MEGKTKCHYGKRANSFSGVQLTKEHCHFVMTEVERLNRGIWFLQLPKLVILCSVVLSNTLR